MREDYADMVDPFVRAESEAWERGYDKGVVTGILYAIGIGFVLALVLFASKIHAAPQVLGHLADGRLTSLNTKPAVAAPMWTFEESRYPIKASERGADITVCHSSGVRFPWQCFAVKS